MTSKFTCRYLSTLAIAFGALLAWAEAQPLRAADPAQGFTTKFRLLDASGQEKTRFKPGERIRLELSITNNTGSTQTLFGQGGELKYFKISGANGEVFASPDKDQKMRNLKFKNGRTRVFRMNWNQRDSKGRAVAAGIYQAEMTISDYVYGNTKLSSPKAIEFQIRKTASSSQSARVVISATASSSGKEVGFDLHYKKGNAGTDTRVAVQANQGDKAIDTAHALADALRRQVKFACKVTVVKRRDDSVVLRIVKKLADSFELSNARSADSGQSIKIE